MFHLVYSLFVAGLCLSTVVCFSPTNRVSRTSVRGSTVVMDGKTRDLRDRIKSVKNTRRITEAMRLVAAARVRRAQEAVLNTRPLISNVQKVQYSLNFVTNRSVSVMLTKRYLFTLKPSYFFYYIDLQVDIERGNWGGS